MRKIMLTSRYKKDFIAALGLIAVLGGNPLFAQATAMVEATANVNISIQEVRRAGVPINNPVDLEGELTISFNYASMVAGDGIVNPAPPGVSDIVGPDPFGTAVGDSTSVFVNVNGSAANGFAEAFGFTDIVHDYANNSTTAQIEVDLLFDYEITAQADITGQNEYAVALVELSVNSLSDGEIIDVVNEFLESKVVLGPFGLQSMSDSVAHTIVIPPGSAGDLIAEIYMDGFAIATVPVPTTLALFSLGLSGIGRGRYRRKKTEKSTAQATKNMKSIKC